MDFADVKFGYYALIISIIKGCLPETAFEMLQSEHPSLVKSQITDADIEDMIKLKAAGESYRGIGELYGMNADAVYYRIRRAQR